MRTVHKYELPIVDEFTLDLPSQHKVVLVDFQNARPMMWVEVDTDSPSRPVKFSVEGTGHQIDGGAVHVGSFIDGAFVWHVYEWPL